MRRILTALAVCAALIVAVAPDAQAKDMNGKFGIGGEAPIGSLGFGSSSSSSDGQAGLSVVAGLAAFNIQVIVGMDRESAGSGDASTTNTDFFLVPRILFPFITEGNAIIHLVGGLGIARSSFSMGDADASQTTFVLEGGVRPEWFVTNFIAFHAQVGLAILLIGDQGESEDSGATIITFLSNASLVGTMGFTFYF